MVSITVRNVPQDVRDELAARAALEGKSLQIYLHEELTQMVEHPSQRQLLERIRRRRPSAKAKLTAEDVVQFVHEARRERDERLL